MRRQFVAVVKFGAGLDLKFGSQQAGTSQLPENCGLIARWIIPRRGSGDSALAHQDVDQGIGGVVIL